MSVITYQDGECHPVQNFWTLEQVAVNNAQLQHTKYTQSVTR